MSDQKSTAVPEERPTGGSDGAVFFVAQRSSRASSLRVGRDQSKTMSDGGRVAQALFRVDASRGELQRFRQSLAIAAIPAPRFSGSRAPARSFIRHQIVEIFCDLDTVSV